MAMVALILRSPSALVRGACRNALLEPSPNVFVGRLDAKRVRRLVEVLEQTQTDALVMVSSARSTLGVKVKAIGHLPDRHPVVVDGIPLIRRSGKMTRSIEESGT